MFWRPVTAIQGGDTDGNHRTDPDQAWMPFITTPSHPEYPAAHTTVGAGALGFYTVWFKTHRFPLAFTGNAGAVRFYTSVEEIHAEEGNARVWAGCIGATAPRWVPRSVAGSAGYRRGIF